MLFSAFAGTTAQSSSCIMGSLIVLLPALASCLYPVSFILFCFREHCEDYGAKLPRVILGPLPKQWPNNN